MVKSFCLGITLGCLLTSATTWAQGSNLVRVSYELVRFAEGLRVAGKTSGTAPLQSLKLFKTLSPAQQGRLVAIRDTESINDALFLLQDSIEIGLFSVTERQTLLRNYDQAYSQSETFQLDLIQALQELDLDSQDRVLDQVRALSPMRKKSREAILDLILDPSQATFSRVIETLNKAEYPRVTMLLRPLVRSDRALRPAIHPTLYYIERFYSLTHEAESSGEMGAQVYFWLQQISQQLQAEGVLKKDASGILSLNREASSNLLSRLTSRYDLAITLAFFRHKFDVGFFKSEIEAHQAWREKTGEVPLEQYAREAPDRVNHQTTSWARDAEALLSTLEGLLVKKPREVFRLR